MPTPFSNLYDVFWSQVTDPVLLNADTYDELKKRYLFNAIPQFKRCKQDLTQKDDTNNTFTIDLTSEEELILGILMVREYLKSQITSYEKLSQKMSNKDWTISSSAEQLGRLLELRRQVDSDINKLIVDYTYNNNDLSGLK